MDEKLKAWTASWHAVLDEELGPEAAPNVEGRYDDPMCDFRLHFSFWELSESAQRKCFAMLPLGKEIADRALESHAWETNMIIPEAEAKRMLVKAIQDVEQLIKFGSSEALLPVSACDPIRVLRGTEQDLEALNAKDIDDLWLEASEIWYDLNMSKDFSAAYSFVGETLYRATSRYEGVFHTLWPYVNAPKDLDPFGNLLRMRQSEIKWLHDENGLIIFYNDDETINDGGELTLQLKGRGLQNVSDQINAFIAKKTEHHLCRGFSSERFDDVEIGVTGTKHKRMKRRPKDNPEGPDLVERGWTSLSNGKLCDPEYALFYDGEKDGPHEATINLMLHFVDGQRQRSKRMERRAG